MKNLLNKILMKFNYKLINITKTTEYINKYTKELEEQIVNLREQRFQHYGFFNDLKRLVERKTSRIESGIT